MKQLTPLDSNFFFYETPNQPMMIGSVWLCDPSTAPDGLVRHKQILQYIDDRLHMSSLFRRRLQQAPLELDDPYWLEDKNFNLEYHVRHVGLPQPGDWRQLCIFVARTMARSVDMNRAPWEIYIIEGVNNVEGVPEGSFAVLIRFHHAYVDGKSAFTLTTNMMEDSPEHDFGAQQGVQYYERPPSQEEMWFRTAPRLFGQSLRAMRAGAAFGLKSAELVQRLFSGRLLEQSRVPQTIFNTQVSPHRTYGAYGWSLQQLKGVRALCEGSTINDVVVSIIAGGMRRYLLAHEALPAEDSLVSMLPVALRPADDKHEGGNLISAMYIPIGTDIEDPVERLKAVQHRTVSHVPVAKEVLYELSNAAGEMLPAYSRSWLARIANETHLLSRVPLFNTVITNVPGIPGMQPKYFAGAKIQSVSPIVPISDMTAITHGVSGIYDFLNIGITADREVVPDMDFYIKCLKASGEEYLERAGVSGPANAVADEQEQQAPAAGRRGQGQGKARANGKSGRGKSAGRSKAKTAGGKQSTSKAQPSASDAAEPGSRPARKANSQA